MAGYAAGGASINQKSPIINSNFSKISGFPPQAGVANYRFAKSENLREIYFDVIINSPRFLEIKSVEPRWVGIASLVGRGCLYPIAALSAILVLIMFE